MITHQTTSTPSPGSGSPVPLASRSLTASGPMVSAIGLGCIGMTSGFYGDADEEAGARAMRRALELGCNFWDTSDAYGPHRNEELIGSVIAGHRDSVFLNTKFGITVDPVTLRRSVDGRPETVRASCDASLRRLGVEHIDLYYPHRVDPRVPIEETVGAMAELVREGKVRHLGLCEAGPETIRRAHAVHPLTAVQTEYSLWSRDPEREILPTLRALDIGLVAYAPLGRGLLSGSHSGPDDLPQQDVRRGLPRFAPDHVEQNHRLAVVLSELAGELAVSPAQLALAWLLHRGPEIVPIPGTIRVEHLEQNLAAARIGLTPDDVQRIEDLVPAPTAERYDRIGMLAVDR